MHNVDVFNLTERCMDLPDLRAFRITPPALKTVRGERKTADSGMPSSECPERFERPTLRFVLRMFNKYQDAVSAAVIKCCQNWRSD
jgi:hypothetical protein